MGQKLEQKVCFPSNGMGALQSSRAPMSSAGRAPFPSYSRDPLLAIGCAGLGDRFHTRPECWKTGLPRDLRPGETAEGVRKPCTHARLSQTNVRGTAACGTEAGVPRSGCLTPARPRWAFSSTPHPKTTVCALLGDPPMASRELGITKLWSLG